MSSSSPSAVAPAPAGAAAAAAAGAGAAAGGANQAPGGGLMSLLQTAFRLYLFYMVFSYLFKGGGGSKGSSPSSSLSSPSSSSPDALQHRSSSPHSNLWPPHSSFSLSVYLSPHPSLDPCQPSPSVYAEKVWQQWGITYDYDDKATREVNVTLSPPLLSSLRANQSLWAHSFFVRDNYPLCPNQLYKGEEAADPSSSLSKSPHRVMPFTKSAIIHNVSPLSVYKPPPKKDKRKNLLTGERNDNSTHPQDEEGNKAVAEEKHGMNSTEEEDEEDDLIIGDLSDPSDVEEERRRAAIMEKKRVKKMGDAAEKGLWVIYFKPSLHLRLVHDFTTYSYNQIPAQILPSIQFDEKSNNYFPIVYRDDFWLLSSHLIPVNHTVQSLSLHIMYSPISLFRWQLQAMMEQSWEMQREMYGGGEGETESIKQILTESNPYFLALTMFVSLLHSIFDFLAFKNDVQFWKNNKNMAGLSARAIATKCFCMSVIFLYLLDNETSYLILISNGIGLCIEFWKLQKAVYIRRCSSFPYIILINKNTIVEEGKEATEEQKSLIATQEYDREAMYYLSWLLYPLVMGYAAYSLYFHTHKSWYSFLISTLVGSVYTFGFIEMCPQLYINYKLKSVAHLPWRMLTYKALNTFIDDLFAFVITMPMGHRIACLRDDVIFFIFLYQKWQYKVDKTRTNEFGFSFEEAKEKEKGDQKKDTIEQKQHVSRVASSASPSSVPSSSSSSAAAALPEEDLTDTLTSENVNTLRQRPAKSQSSE